LLDENNNIKVSNKSKANVKKSIDRYYDKKTHMVNNKKIMNKLLKRNEK
jgi:hypothetical protein